MNRLSIPASRPLLIEYLLLTKPGIIMGNAVTTVGGFALASRGHFDLLLFLVTLIGISLIIGSACVFNNYIDRELDQKMVRTQNRALAKGVISTQNAMLFASVLLLLGGFVLAYFVNFLVLAIALLGFFMYIGVYSFLKYYSTHATLVGSIAGSIPPVIGYCAVTNYLDMGAAIFFIMMTFWQMPHFFAIAIYRLQDYEASGIPVLPLKRGIQKTKIQMVLYIIGFIAASSLLTVYHYTGTIYFIVATLLGLSWLGFSIKGFMCKHHATWARKMFIFSLVVIMGICIAIPF
ncbi:MAG: heme o synthase [Chlamydiota bacterium]